MERRNHSLAALFSQLGLDGTDQAIQKFMLENAPLSRGVELHKAAFWNYSQAAFLQQAKDEDADWVAIVDSLDLMLRNPNPIFNEDK